eukprot:2288103-Rhodomonas_salina.3
MGGMGDVGAMAAGGGTTGAVGAVLVAAGDKEVIMESLEEMRDHGKEEEEEDSKGKKKQQAGGKVQKGGRWIMSENDATRGLVLEGGSPAQPYGILPNSYPANGGWADPDENSFPANIWNIDENQMVQMQMQGHFQQPHRYPFDDPSNMYMGYNNGQDGAYYGPGEA